MKRRATAVRRSRDDDTRIPATRQVLDGASNLQLDHPKAARTARTWPGRFRRLQRQVYAQTYQRYRRDGERILFRFLALLGASLFVVSCLTLNITSVSTFGRVIKDSIEKEGHNNFLESKYGTVPERIEFLPADFGIGITEHPPDFGGLKIDLFRDYPTENPASVLAEMKQDYYYNFDDDYQRNPFNGVNERKADYHDEKQCCRRISEHRLYFPNCNTFHEAPFLESEGTYIGSGAYRDAFTVRLPFAGEKETVVVKDMALADDDYGYDYASIEFTRMDAIVGERLTASPRIFDIFGACGIGIMSEYLQHGHLEAVALQEEDIDFVEEGIDVTDQEEPLICYNDLPVLSKLKMSLQMAEAIADIHGYPGGAIVHQDMKLDQFFFSADKSKVILSDFNRAEFLLWDHCNEKYCEHKSGEGAGNWRAPEEYLDKFLTEKVDVYALGNNIYGLLTGLMPFQEKVNWWDAYLHVKKGDKVFIDPRYKERSLAEAKLVEIIEKCHELNPKHRPSIFEVVEFLRHALQEVTGVADIHDTGALI